MGFILTRTLGKVSYLQIRDILVNDRWQKFNILTRMHETIFVRSSDAHGMVFGSKKIRLPYASN